MCTTLQKWREIDAGIRHRGWLLRAYRYRHIIHMYERNVNKLNNAHFHGISYRKYSKKYKYTYMYNKAHPFAAQPHVKTIDFHTNKLFSAIPYGLKHGISYKSDTYITT